MSLPPVPERRPIDGFIRRSPIQPTPPASAPAPAPQDADSALPSATVSQSLPPVEPVFEYRKPAKKQRHIGRWVTIAVISLALLVGGWLAYKAFIAVNKIVTKAGGVAPALAGAIDLTKLKGEGDGRVNIVLLGIGGPGHEAPNLTDTMMVVSLDPKTKHVAMLSVPRDMYVKYTGKGNSAGKINAANAYGGPELSRKTLQTIIGVPIHYYVLVDFSGFKKAIDAVGGVDINVPQAIYDPEYPCDNGKHICPFTMKTGMQHMNGATALKYARSRKSTSDFDRAARQQLVLVALRDKSMKLSTLTNPVKLAGLIDSIGDHVKTDLQVKEMRKLADISKDIDTSKIANELLDIDGTDALLVGGTNIIPGAGYIEVPKAGTFAYRDIHDFVKNIFVDHYITDEKARVEVQNGSGIVGLAGQVVASLKAAHYNVADPVNAPDQVTQTVIYDYTNGKKPYTINYLEKRFGVTARKATRPTVSPTPSEGTQQTGSTTPPEIRIILGSDYKRAGYTN